MAYHWKPQFLHGMIIVMQSVFGGTGTYVKPSAQFRLINDLLDVNNYSPKARPVRDHTQPVNVELRLNLYQILDVNERQQSAALSVWVVQTWQDELLFWKADSYENISSIVLPYEDIWLPDTYLYNSLTMERVVSEHYISVILNAVEDSATGRQYSNVSFRYPAILTLSCKMNILYFPFDEQNCTLTFGSWTYDSSGIDFFSYSEDILLESYIQNEEWQVLSFKMYRHRIKFNCCDVPFTLLKAHLLIRRKPLFYLVNLVVPTFIITLISIIGFYMPTSTSGERTEKVNLGITTLLAMSILLLMVSDQMPTTSDFIPLIGWFYLNIIILISLGTLLSSIMIVVHQSGHNSKRVPRNLLTFCLTLAGIFCMHIPQQIRKPSDKSKKNMSPMLDTIAENSINEQFKLISQNSHSPSQPTPPTVTTRMALSNRDVPAPIMNHEEIDSEVAKQTDIVVQKFKEQLVILNLKIDKIIDHLREQKRDKYAVDEWDFITNVLDRLFLSIFSTVAFVMTAALIMVAQYANQGHS